VNEIGSLGLQKLGVVVAMGFSNVPSPLLMLRLVMIVILVVVIVQE
jgi:hypothetical protein